jgi:glycosyltransferase involved in cell wall biosynthesis
MARLLFFTQTYPYGNGEAFIEAEIGYLARVFDEIVILPWIGKGAPARAVPPNCRVLPPMLKDATDTIREGIFSRAPVAYFIRHFFAGRAYATPGRAVKYIRVSVFCRAILSCPDFKRVNREFRDETIYFYWGIGTAYLLPFIENKRAKIVRFHGADLYAERHASRYIPFREEVYGALTRAVYVSRQGMEYAAARVAGADRVDARLSYLGTVDRGLPRPARPDDRVYLLSCSRVIPVKRVFLLLEALRRITGLPIVWTHLGGGRHWKRLARAAARRPDNVEIRLPGEMTNQKVLEYYQNNPVDLFVNVSSSEGLPVSIMEAISFNVPVLATRVGGTAEIVTGDVGRLLEPDVTPAALALALQEIIRDRATFHPRARWEESFSAANNYPRFIQEVLLG